MTDYPGIVIPVHSYVDPILDPINKNFKPANERDAYVQALCMPPFALQRHGELGSDANNLGTDSPEIYAGAPITVQLVCRRFREEGCIGLASVIIDALKA